MFDPGYLASEIITMPILILCNFIVVFMAPLGPFLMQMSWIGADSSNPGYPYKDVTWLQLYGVWGIGLYTIGLNTYKFWTSNLIFIYDVFAAFTLFGIWFV